VQKKYYYIYLIVAFCIVFAACSGPANKSMPSLTETFSRADRKPFGAYIAYSQMENMFSRNSIRDKKQSFTKTWNEISDTSSLYVCFTPNLYVNDDEVKAMLGYVYAGNDLFIAANYIDKNLLDEIGCGELYIPLPVFNFFDSVKTTATTFAVTPYSYYYHPFKNSFSEYNTALTKVLGVNEENNANYIVYFHGNGRLFLHCDPKAFSNYFLLKNDNYRYMQNAFAYVNSYPDHLYWDEYYRKLGSRRERNNSSDEKKFSSLNEIMKHPPLAAAFWLSLLSLLLYILFGLKRKQRIIEKRKPNENTTVTFTETIGRLYLQKKDNKNIAEKMTTYFNEYVRNNYYLNTNTVNEDFITTLSRKSGVQREKVEALYRVIHHIHNNTVVDDYQLLSLNEQIQNFYKRNN
jgi:hypothetical protein